MIGVALLGHVLVLRGLGQAVALRAKAESELDTLEVAARRVLAPRAVAGSSAVLAVLVIADRGAGPRAGLLIAACVALFAFSSLRHACIGARGAHRAFAIVAGGDASVRLASLLALAATGNATAATVAAAILLAHPIALVLTGNAGLRLRGRPLDMDVRALRTSSVRLMAIPLHSQLTGRISVALLAVTLSSSDMGHFVVALSTVEPSLIAVRASQFFVLEQSRQSSLSRRRAFRLASGALVVAAGLMTVLSLLFLEVVFGAEFAAATRLVPWLAAAVVCLGLQTAALLHLSLQDEAAVAPRALGAATVYLGAVLCGAAVWGIEGAAAGAATGAVIALVAWRFMDTHSLRVRGRGAVADCVSTSCSEREQGAQ